MTSFIKKAKMFVSCIIAGIMVILTEFIIKCLMQSDPGRLSSFWEVGNAWIRLLGCLLAVYIVLLVIILAAEIYGTTNERLKFGLCGALIGSGLVIMAVLALIYFGSARMDSIFTVEAVEEHEDTDREYRHEKAIVSEDGMVEITYVVGRMGRDYMHIEFGTKNLTEQKIVFDDVKYSILTPGGQIVSGSAYCSEEDSEKFYTAGTVVNRFYVVMGMVESGKYEVELTLSYFDDSGQIHSINYKAPIQHQ